MFASRCSSGVVGIESMCHAQGFYLPFCLLAFDVMIGGNWVADVLGILGGHLYYFLKVRESTLCEPMTLLEASSCGERSQSQKARSRPRSDLAQSRRQGHHG